MKNGQIKGKGSGRGYLARQLPDPYDRRIRLLDFSIARVTESLKLKRDPDVIERVKNEIVGMNIIRSYVLRQQAEAHEKAAKRKAAKLAKVKPSE